MAFPLLFDGERCQPLAGSFPALSPKMRDSDCLPDVEFTLHGTVSNFCASVCAHACSTPKSTDVGRHVPHALASRLCAICCVPHDFVFFAGYQCKHLVDVFWVFWAKKRGSDWISDFDFTLHARVYLLCQRFCARVLYAKVYGRWSPRAERAGIATRFSSTAMSTSVSRRCL